MTEITDEIRAGVLRAIARNMSLDYAARADGITVAQAEQIARAAGWPDDMTQVYREWQQLRAELEYFGQVPPKGPTPERGEKLEDYVARVRVLEAEATDEPERCAHGYVEADCPDFGCPFTHQSPADARALAELIASEEVDLIPVDQPLQALPPATDSPARAKPKPRQVPCEVCGHGVLVSYVEANGGRQRHGHHPEES